MKIKGLYFITDRKLSRHGIAQDVRDAIAGGCRIIQYREKEKSFQERLAEARQLAEICRKNNVLFIVNNDVEIAIAVNACGVHLGQEDMPLQKARRLLGKKIIGVTVHDLGEALEAERLGADYVSVSPIFHTDTKPDAGKPAGIQLVKEVKAAVKIPVVAIGGINENNLRSVIAAGADSVAIISAILNSSNVRETVERMVGAVNDAGRER